MRFVGHWSPVRLSLQCPLNWLSEQQLWLFHVTNFCQRAGILLIIGYDISYKVETLGSSVHSVVWWGQDAGTHTMSWTVSLAVTVVLKIILAYVCSWKSQDCVPVSHSTSRNMWLCSHLDRRAPNLPNEIQTFRVRCKFSCSYLL